MRGWVIALVILPCIFGLDVLIITTLMRTGWSRLTQGFPASPIGPGAVRRNFQSFAAGMYNLGFCVHVAVDENYLHLLPARVIRWSGGKASSVPWESVVLVKPGARVTRVRIGSSVISGPTWCLEMATPAAS
ncbi:MAG: hypothetical protein IT437_02395 [Phycisphaerales bacterium]|nr:hypothetical protein [Phycisphaerales bacterium]